MTTQSMDQGQMLLIVVLVGALLYMFMKNHKGGVCSLFGGNKDTFIISAAPPREKKFISPELLAKQRKEKIRRLSRHS